VCATTVAELTDTTKELLAGPAATGIKTPITFPQRGFCDITLTVTDSAGQSNFTFTQKSVKVPMIVKDSIEDSIIVKTSDSVDGKEVFRISPHHFSGLTVNFDASASYDPDGSIVSYNWTTTCDASATGMITAITFPRAATCEITLTVMDDADPPATSSVTQKVTVPITGLTVVKESHEPDNPGSGQVLMVPNNSVALNCFLGICANQQGNYYPGSTVRLVAKPYPGSVFAGWDDDCTNDSSTVDVDASVLNLPEGSVYNWTTSSCDWTPAGTPPTTGAKLYAPTAKGVKAAITIPPGETCSLALKVTDSAGTTILFDNTSSPVELKLPMTEDLIRVKKPGSSDDAFYILPHANLLVTMNEQSKSCTAYFDVDPNPPNLPKLTVQLWDAKTGTLAAPGPAPEIGWVIDNRQTINLGVDSFFGDEHHKSVTYYNAGAYVRLRSIASHLDKVNSGAKTYWEFAQWDCSYNDGNSVKKVEPVMNPTARDLFVQKGTLKLQIDSMLRKPQVRFPMPEFDTICLAYFNRELDIAGQELRKKTYDEGTIDTGETPSERYPMDKGNNAARLREALYWAQPAILAIEAIVNLSTPETIKETWPKATADDPNSLADKEFFRPASAGKEKEEGKEYTKSVRIRPKDAVVVGFVSTGTVEGYYIEVRVMLMNKDGEEEEVPILKTYEDKSQSSVRRGLRGFFAIKIGTVSVR
ncbi:MAG: hypothetical protein BWK78_05645, partial [Thiotrichaceae bacterium IS1]